VKRNDKGSTATLAQKWCNGVSHKGGRRALLEVEKMEFLEDERRHPVSQLAGCEKKRPQEIKDNDDGHPSPAAE